MRAPPGGHKDKITFRAPHNLSAYYEAFTLAQREYVRAGYVSENVSGLRYTRLHLLPSTGMVLAYLGEEIVGTGSIILDECKTLPAEQTFGDIFDGLRNQGRSLADVPQTRAPSQQCSR